MNGSTIFNVSMRGWICLVLTIGLTACVLMKIPIDTQFFTIINSVLVAYVVQTQSKAKGKETNGFQDSIEINKTEGQNETKTTGRSNVA